MLGPDHEDQQPALATYTIAGIERRPDGPRRCGRRRYRQRIVRTIRNVDRVGGMPARGQRIVREVDAWGRGRQHDGIRGAVDAWVSLAVAGIDGVAAGVDGSDDRELAHAGMIPRKTQKTPCAKGIAIDRLDPFDGSGSADH